MYGTLGKCGLRAAKLETNHSVEISIKHTLQVFRGIMNVSAVLKVTFPSHNRLRWIIYGIDRDFCIAHTTNINEPRHEKTCIMPMRTTKVQISLRIRAVWSAPLLFAV